MNSFKGASTKMMTMARGRCRVQIEAVVIVALATLFLGVWGVQSASAAADCRAAAPSPLSFDQAKGIRTKWLTLTHDARNTIAPDLEGLPLKQWMANFEAVGVNLAEINLEPQWKLASRPVVSDAALIHATEVLSIPPARRTDSDSGGVAALLEDVFPHWKYTAAQRNEVQLDFLRRLEELRRNGEIAGSVRFMIHQRLWFPSDAAGGSAAKREIHAAQFAEDMASFIRLAEQNCLGHWLAGVRLGEHSNNDMSELLPLIVELADRINVGTNGWLKTHLFLVNGGGWGAEYKGIDRVIGADGRPYPFFARIATETGGFAFAYKWMQFHDQVGAGVRGHMRVSYCAPGRLCDSAAIADWDTYLGDTLGFNDLLAFITTNRRRYPANANVVFVGDASDGIPLMVTVTGDGRLTDGPPLIAVRRLFAKAGRAGFSGKIFMNGYRSVKIMTRLKARLAGLSDIGQELYFVDAAGESHLLPQSERIWADWPGP